MNYESPRHPVLLYDGLCGFCDHTVQFVLRHDRHGSISFAPLQGSFAAGVRARYRELDSVDSLVLVEYDVQSGAEHVLVRSDAIIRLGEYVGGGWQFLKIGKAVPRAARDYAYDLFARNRYRLFGRLTSCPIPSADVRARFLD
jgi:predicted DCC family thiol-disulfide oxidoreductase YuxK